MTTIYKIEKAQGVSPSGSVITVWNVVDAADGYVFDTFSRKRDAVAWINARNAT